MMRASGEHGRAGAACRPPGARSAVSRAVRRNWVCVVRRAERSRWRAPAGPIGVDVREIDPPTTKASPPVPTGPKKVAEVDTCYTLRHPPPGALKKRLRSGVGGAREHARLLARRTMYSFRLRFHLLEGDRFDFNVPEVELARLNNGAVFKLKSGGRGDPIDKHSRLSIVGSPFPSEEEARRAGQSARNALIIWGAMKRRGIDTGEDRLRSLFTPAGLSLLEREHQQRVRNDMHGLDVYEAEPRPLFVALNIELSLNSSPASFLETIVPMLISPPVFSSKLLLSAELFTASFLERSHRTRFLMLMTSIEALLAPKRRGAVVEEFVDRIQGEASMLAVEPETVAAIRGAVEWLRHESIGQTGRALASKMLGTHTYAGLMPSRFFQHIYTIRSNVIHSGAAPKSVDLLDLSNEVSTFVGDLLEATLAAADGSA